MLEQSISSSEAETVGVADLVIGSTMPVRNVGPINQEHLIRFAGATGDFNPFHYDAELVRSRGFDAVFAQGQFTAGILGQMLANWVGQVAIRRFAFRFVAPAYLGDVLRFGVTVVRTYDEDGAAAADANCEVVSADGRVVLTGTVKLMASAA